MIRSAGTVGSGGAVDKRLVLFMSSASQFILSVMTSALSIALPSIGRELAVGAVTLSWVQTVYPLAMAVLLVPVGRMADAYGRRRVFLYGAWAWTIASLLCGLTASAPLLIAFRGLQGIAGALLNVTAVAILTSVYSPRERGRALGISISVVYVGLAAGPSVGGIMTQQLGWRSTFFLSAILGAIIAALTVWKMRVEWTDSRGEKLDLVGSAIFGLTLLAAMYGFSVLPTTLGISLILLGVLGLATFVRWESRVPNPVFNVSLFLRNTVFALSSLAALIVHTATFAINFLLSLYLQYVMGLDPQTAGLVLLAQPVTIFIFSPVAGLVSDRVEPRIVSSAGMAVSCVGLALLASVGGSSSPARILVSLVVCGFGIALFSSPNTNAIMGAVQKSDVGIASATVSLVRVVGQMLSMGVATLILAVYVGGAQITPQYHASFSSGFRLAFVIYSALCIVGIPSSMARGKLHGARGTDPVVLPGPRLDGEEEPGRTRS